MSKGTEQPAWGSVLVFELGAAGSSGIILRAVDEEVPQEGMAGGERGAFGVELSQLLQVAEPFAVSPVPLAPAVVLGIMNFHGRIVTVVDPAPILGLSVPAVSGPDSRVLLMRQGQSNTGNVGLYVSRVQNIVPATALELTDVIPGPCVRWVLQDGQRLINIIQVEPLLEGLARQFGSEKLPRQGVIG